MKTTSRRLRLSTLLTASAFALLAGCSSQGGHHGMGGDMNHGMRLSLSGASEVPAVSTQATGMGMIRVGTDRSVSGRIMTSGLQGTMAHIHQGAPEQAHSSKASDARSDQYSLGVILYQCVTGKLPFDAETYFALLSKIVLGDFAKPRDLKPEIPAELEAAILRAMSRDAADRFESVQAFGRAVLPFAGEEVRVVFRRAFGGSGDTAAYKAVTVTPAVVPSVPPPPAAKPPLESTLSAATRERRAEATAPALKRAAPVIGGIAVVALLVGGYSLRASRTPNTVVAGAGSSPIAASPDASAPSNAALAHAPVTSDAGVLALVHDGAVASPLLAAQTQDAGARGHGARGRGRDPLRGFMNLFSGSPRR